MNTVRANLKLFSYIDNHFSCGRYVCYKDFSVVVKFAYILILFIYYANFAIASVHVVS